MCEPEEDLPKEEFIEAMAARFAEHTGELITSWIEYARGYYEEFKRESSELLPAGEDFDWCEQAAKELADEEILKSMAVNNLYDLYLLADARADRVQSQLTEARNLNEKFRAALEKIAKPALGSKMQQYIAQQALAASQMGEAE